MRQLGLFLLLSWVINDSASGWVPCIKNSEPVADTEEQKNIEIYSCTSEDGAVLSFKMYEKNDISCARQAQQFGYNAVVIESLQTTPIKTDLTRYLGDLLQAKNLRIEITEEAPAQALGCALSFDRKQLWILNKVRLVEMPTAN